MFDCWSFKYAKKTNQKKIIDLFFLLNSDYSLHKVTISLLLFAQLQKNVLYNIVSLFALK